MNYITELQKNEIDKKYFPNGFFYTIKTFDPTSYSNSKRFNEPFENITDYERAVKIVRHSNALRFFHTIKTMNEVDFINEINSQYLNYTLENIENSQLWLSLTYDLVLKGFSVGKIEDVKIRSVFIEWYNFKVSELNKQPQQSEAVKPDEVKKDMHLKIFVENAFDIWEQMFESFKINKTKRTDLSFMYEVMLYDKLIHKTVSKKNYEDWINGTYNFGIDKIHYTDIKTTANEKRMATYNLIKQSK